MHDRYLFRAKRTDNGKWVKGMPFEIEGKTMILIQDDDNILRTHYLDENTWNAEIYCVEVDKSTICRCTGLKDKNGKLIRENDIIKHYNDTSHPEKYDEGIVRWNEFNIRFERYSTEMNGSVCMNRDCVYEVIGNIFDNPDLLEVGEL